MTRTRHGCLLLGALCALVLGIPTTGHAQNPAAAPDSAQVAPDSAQVEAPDSAAPARAVLAALDSVYLRITLIADSIRDADPDRAALLRLRSLELVDTLGELKGHMSAELRLVRPDYAGIDSILGVYEDFLRREFTLVEEGVEFRSETLDSLRTLRRVTPLEGLDDLEEQITRANAQLDTTLIFVVESLQESDALGIDMQEQWGQVDRFLLARAAEEMGRLQLALAERGTIRDRLAEAAQADAAGEELDELEARRLLAEQRVAGEAAALEATADLLDRRSIPTATYRQLLIQATGEVTSDVLDPTVAVGLLRDWGERLWNWVEEAGPNLLVQLAIVLASIVLSRAGFRVTWRVFRRTGGRKVSRLLTDLLERMLMPVASAVGLVIGLTAVGVDTTAILASLGVLGVIVGLALQDTLGNLAAGMFILVYRPFDVDDIVSTAGVTGTVRTMGLAATTIVTFDNRRVFVPNSKVWGEIIENRSAERTRRVDVQLRIPHAEDSNRVIGIAERTCSEYDLVLPEPEPLVYVRSIDESLLELEVRAWAATGDWWTVTTQLPRLLSMALKGEGIDPPYPRQIEYEIGGYHDPDQAGL